ncbi:MAG: hypothetical protein NVS1B2_03800 [Vulcanimicrobiaceae bacterium]
MSAASGAAGAEAVLRTQRGIATVGRPAPRFVVSLPDGRDLSSRMLLGRPLLINVFASWCGNCRVEEPVLVDAYARYRTRVRFLGIDEQEGVAKATGFARALHVPYPIALDNGQFAATYDTLRIPQTILIDGRGVVRAVFRGRVSAAVLDRELAALVARKGTT